MTKVRERLARLAANRLVAVLRLPGMTYCGAGLTGMALLDDHVVDP